MYNINLFDPFTGKDLLNYYDIKNYKIDCFHNVHHFQLVLKNDNINLFKNLDEYMSNKCQFILYIDSINYISDTRFKKDYLVNIKSYSLEKDNLTLYLQ